MKRFEFDSIKQRLIKSMKMKTEWAQILDNGVISNLLDVYAEAEAELARYMEYLIGESKYATARNMTSLTRMGDLISHKRRRPVSSAGYVVVSHTDDQGVNRLANFGRTFFNLDDPSNYDDKELSPTSTTSEEQSLVPWTHPNIYSIPKGTIFTASNGVKFLSTKNVFSRFLASPFSSIKDDEEKMRAFKASGGWNGIKYLYVPVVQGIEKEVSIGMSRGGRFESFVLEAQDVESAANAMTSEYFYVTVTSNDGETTEKWVEVPNIRLAGPYDKVFEAVTLDDGSGILFKFGDGVSGRMLTKGNIVSVHYLETLGSLGNINNKFQINTMTFPKNITMIDPRTNTASSFLSCVNIHPLLGGRDSETEEEYRLNAPTSYIKSYATATTKEYVEKIRNYSPVSLLHLRVFPQVSFETNTLDSSVNDLYTEVANEYTTIKNTLKISAVQSNGDKILDPENTFIRPIIESLNSIKGPNDSFEFCEPNFIKVAVSVIVSTTSTQYSDEEIAGFIKNACLDKYSIFNIGFQTPLYKSNIISLTRGFPFTDTVAVEVNALANVDYSGVSIGFASNTVNPSADDVLVFIPFKFDTVYAQNKYMQGFKNYTTNSGYLLKVDLKFNSAAKSNRNRTLFLFDNRLDTLEIPSVEDAKLSALTAEQTPPISKRVKDPTTGSQIIFHDETSPFYRNRQVRVGQFHYIQDITDDAFMSRVADTGLTPYEIRPYVVDTEGVNKTFPVEEVPASLQVSPNGDNTSQECYKRDTDYIPNTNIIFSESYDSPESPNYATGKLVLPLSYFGVDINQIDVKSDSLGDTVAAIIESSMKIAVSARPLQEDFYPTGENDLMFIDPDMIRVEKKFLI